MINWNAVRSVGLGLFGLALTASGSTLVSTTGQVTVLGTPPADVASGGLQSNTTAYVFQESMLTLTSDLDVDVSTPGVYTTVSSLTPGTIDAGTSIVSYMLESQPSSVPPLPDDYRTYQGSLTFDEPILGLIVETTSLNNTDALLGAPGTTYPPPSDIYSGLDLNTPGCKGSSCGDDAVTWTITGNTIYFDFVTNYSEDEIRIITAATPEPGGIAFVLIGLLLCLGLKFARRSAGKRDQIALRGE
jgi:hypothetical protein